MRVVALILLALGLEGRLGPFGIDADPAGPRVDLLALWPEWFERERDVLLAERIRARRAADPVAAADVRTVVVPLLLECLPDSSSLLRDASVIALGKIGGPGTAEPLAKRRNDPDRDIRNHARIALGLTGESAALAPLLAAVGEGDPESGAWAAAGLGLLGREEAIPALLRALRDEETGPFGGRREGAVLALGALKAKDAVPDLVRILESPAKDATLSRSVCPALAAIGTDPCRDALVLATGAHEGTRRAAAALALGGFQGIRATAALMRQMKSSGRMEKLYSLLSLGRFARSEGGKVRRAVLSDLAEIASLPAKDRYAANFAALGLALADDHQLDDLFIAWLGADAGANLSPEIRSAAGMALALLGQGDAGSPLATLLGNPNESTHVRAYAALALGILGDPTRGEAVRKAFRSADSPLDVACAAASGTPPGRVPGPRTVPARLGPPVDAAPPFANRPG